MKPIKVRTYYAIVNGAYVQEDADDSPLLYRLKSVAESFANPKDRIVRVEIRELPRTAAGRKKT